VFDIEARRCSRPGAKLGSFGFVSRALTAFSIAPWRIIGFVWRFFLAQNSVISTLRDFHMAQWRSAYLYHDLTQSRNARRVRPAYP